MEDNECPVCYESDKPLERISNNCSHMFCINCITNLDRITVKCPYCRTQIVRDKICFECCNNSKAIDIKRMDKKNYCLNCIKKYLKNNAIHIAYGDRCSIYVEIIEYTHTVGFIIENIIFDQIKDILTDIRHLNKMKYYHLDGFYSDRNTLQYTPLSLVKYLSINFSNSKEFKNIIIKNKNRLQNEYQQELKHKQYFSMYVLPYVLNDQESMYKDFYFTYVMNEMKYVHKYGIYLNTQSDSGKYF